MGINWLAFAGGAAEAGSEFIKEERQNAADAAEAQVKQMYQSYSSKKKESEEKIGKLSDNIAYVRSAMPNATEAELFDMAQNPAVMETITSGLKDGSFDPALINLSSIGKIAKENDTKTAEQLVKEMYSLKPSASKPEEEKPAEGIAGFLSGIGKREAKVASERLAGVAGLTMEELRGAQEYDPQYQPKSKLDLETMQNKRPIEDRINEARNNVVSAREAMSGVDMGDPVAKQESAVKLNESIARLGRLIEGQQLFDTKGKTEPQIQSEMVTRIQKLPEGSQARLELEAQLRQRKELLKSVTGSDENKVTVANKISAVSKAFNEMVKAALPTGAFTIDEEGNYKLTSLATDPIRKKAVYSAQLNLLQNKVNAEGRVTDEGDRLALMAAGITFKPDGTPILTKPIASGNPDQNAAVGDGDPSAALAGRTAPSRTGAPPPQKQDENTSNNKTVKVTY